MKIIKTKSGANVQRWDGDDYKAAVRVLRQDARFIGFENKDGFNLSDVKKWSSKKKKDIKQAIATRNYLQMREATDTVAYIGPKSKKQRKEVLQLLGYGEHENLGFKHLKNIPLVKPTFVESKDVRLEYDEKNKTITVKYLKHDLQQIRVNIDYVSIFKEMDEAHGFDLEEEEIKDSFLITLEKYLFDRLGQYEDGKSFYRPATFAGEITLTNYGIYTNVPDVARAIYNMAEKYFDMGRYNFGLMVNAVIVSRRLSDRPYNTPHKIAAAETKNAKVDKVKRRAIWRPTTK